MFIRKLSLASAAILMSSLASIAQTTQNLNPPPVAKPQQAVATTPPELERMRKQMADWSNLARYRAEDEALPSPAPGEKRVVFFGDSITDRLGAKGRYVLPRQALCQSGISGQTTPQMLIRFQQGFCAKNGLIYLAYYSAMADESGGMMAGLSSDEVHPTEKGYEVMAPLAEAGITQALRQR